jgi:hypothetical protein
LSTQNASTSPLFNGPRHHGGRSVTAISAAAGNVAARVIYVSDINTADFLTVGDVASETTAGARGEGEGMQAQEERVKACRWAEWWCKQKGGCCCGRQRLMV